MSLKEDLENSFNQAKDYGFDKICIISNDTDFAKLNDVEVMDNCIRFCNMTGRHLIIPFNSIRSIEVY